MVSAVKMRLRIHSPDSQNEAMRTIMLGSRGKAGIVLIGILLIIITFYIVLH